MRSSGATNSRLPGSLMNLTRRDSEPVYLAKLARRFGPSFTLSTITATEFADQNKHADQSDARAISAEERGHVAVIRNRPGIPP